MAELAAQARAGVGHRYRSQAPPVLGQVTRPPGTPLEQRLTDLMLIA
ncbi:MAG: hypothetical protein ABWX84_06825 [Nocardioides sp.]